jgi:arsenate reductase (thioredoxin)
MTRVLFVCIGNSCRSQMAEGFARRYGGDVLEADSAGLAPAGLVAPETRRVMEEKNISLDHHFPKALSEMPVSRYEIIVNMSGYPLPGGIRNSAEVREWKVEDPIGRSEDVHRAVRDRVENLVMQLILSMRSRRPKNP